MEIVSWTVKWSALTRTATYVLVPACMACGNDQTRRETGPTGSEVRQVTLSSRASVAQPSLWILLLDDAPTEKARALRKQVASEMPGWINHWRASSCVEADDVAVYWPVDLQVLVVPSSDPRSAVHSGLVEALALNDPNATSTTAATWESTVASSILAIEATTLRDNDLLTSAAYWEEMLRLEREPEREADAVFLSRLHEDTLVSVFVATSRDDSSGLDFNSRAFGTIQPAGWTVLISSGEDCSPEVERDFPLIADWRIRVRRCDESLLRDGLACDYKLDCVTAQPVVRTDGQVACRVLAYADPNVTCPQELGWFDPMNSDGKRAPRLIPDATDSQSRERRVCEIVQLSDDALNSCQTELNCDNCSPGWCLRRPFADSEWDWRAQSCAEEGGWNETQIRLVEGSNIAANAQLFIQCDLDVR